MEGRGTGHRRVKKAVATVCGLPEQLRIYFGSAMSKQRVVVISFSFTTIICMCLLWSMLFGSI